MARDRSSTSFADIFDGQLERQYQRVKERVPRLACLPDDVRVTSDGSAGVPWSMDGHCFLAVLPSGHILACLNLLYEGSLRELPSLLIETLQRGPGLQVKRGERVGSLEDVVNGTLTRMRDLGERLEQGHRPSDSPKLKLTSEMHSIVYVEDADAADVSRQGQPDDQLIARLTGRLENSGRRVEDRSILWPNEFNKVAGTLGAVRPGASLIVGSDESAEKNALISTLLLMGAASLLREVRDEVYAIQSSATKHLAADVRFDWRGRGPLGEERMRLAHVEMAVALDIESYLDIRRIISDAKLVQWHACFSEALAIPQSVTALHEMGLHLGSAMQTVSDRSTARTAFIISAWAAIFAAAAVVVTVLLSA